jgi:dynein heavy chain
LSVGSGFVKDNDMNLNEHDVEAVVKMFKIIH